MGEIEMLEKEALAQERQWTRSYKDPIREWRKDRKIWGLRKLWFNKPPPRCIITLEVFTPEGRPAVEITFGE